MWQLQVGPGHQVVGVEVDQPRPRADEAVVQVVASSVNRGELELIAARDVGWTPGQDLAGVILEPAADGSGPPRGARVAGLAGLGAWAERAVIPAQRLARVPDGVALTDAAAVPAAGLTALRTLRLAGTLLGRRVLVTGASGGVGRMIVQLARDAGAHVTAVSRRGAVPAADVTVPRPGDADPVDAVVDGVGGRAMLAALGALRPHGTLVLYGNTGGEPAPLSIQDFVGHENARILTYFTYAADGDPAADLAEVLDRVADGRLHPGVVEVVGFAEASAATARLASGGVRGKLVLVAEQDR